MEKKPKKEKARYVDDGHTIYPMDGLTAPRVKTDNSGTGLNKKERRAAIRAAYATYLPILGIVLGCFLLTMLVISFWLK